MTRWRADIDGLRGLAVLLVVAFHSAPGLFPNGYIGVDIFFVISGFVITNSIHHDLVNKKFSFKRFFCRRLNRLLPSLLFMMLLMCIVNLVFLFPLEIKSISLDMLMSLLFIQNINLANNHAYFSDNWYVEPLQHLWSLSVEEQFYILFAVLIIFFQNKNYHIGAINKIFIAIFLFSFAASFIYGNASDSYYNFFYRIWEIVTGILAYLLHKRRFKFIQRNLPITLFMLILIFTLATINKYEQTFYLSLFLLNTSVAILLMVNNCGLQRIFLANRIFVLLGRVSYPWYLLHWPFLSYYRILFGVDPNVTDKLVLVFLSLLLSIAVTVFIEKREVLK